MTNTENTELNKVVTEQKMCLCNNQNPAVSYIVNTYFLISFTVYVHRLFFFLCNTYWFGSKNVSIQHEKIISP